MKPKDNSDEVRQHPPPEPPTPVHKVKADDLQADREMRQAKDEHSTGKLEKTVRIGVAAAATFASPGMIESAPAHASDRPAHTTTAKPEDGRLKTDFEFKANGQTYSMHVAKDHATVREHKPEDPNGANQEQAKETVKEGIKNFKEELSEALEAKRRREEEGA